MFKETKANFSLENWLYKYVSIKTRNENKQVTISSKVTNSKKQQINSNVNANVNDC